MTSIHQAQVSRKLRKLRSRGGCGIANSQFLILSIHISIAVHSTCTGKNQWLYSQAVSSLKTMRDSSSFRWLKVFSPLVGILSILNPRRGKSDSVSKTMDFSIILKSGLLSVCSQNKSSTSTNEATLKSGSPQRIGIIWSRLLMKIAKLNWQKAMKSSRILCAKSQSKSHCAC